MTCKRGHDLAAARVVFSDYYSKSSGAVVKHAHRVCRKCIMVRRRDRRLAEGRVQSSPQINSAQTHCPQGHRYAGPNLLVCSRRWWSKRAGAWKMSRYRKCLACRMESWMDAKARQLGLEARL